MFRKMLIANRGEIAVRIVRACREMEIETLALYEEPDRGSLHVRLADECVNLDSPQGFMDQETIIHIAREKGADAIHPGYGFLAERADFINACEEAGIAFIGPPTGVVEMVNEKLGTLQQVREAGFATVTHSAVSFEDEPLQSIQEAAAELGYPLIIKSCRGGRGPAEQLARNPQQLEAAVRRAQATAQSVFYNCRIYLEKAILRAHQVGVQIMGDKHGNLVHLGEREGSIQTGSRKVIEESPAPCLTPAQREKIVQTALNLARLFNYQNVGTVEFLVDEEGNFYFTEIKARLQVEHPLTEMASRVDLVQEQIRIAAGEPLSLRQEDVMPVGWAMMSRISAEDPWNRFLPSPGQLRRVRLPGGPEVRVDTYVYCECEVPGEYDPLIAKLTVWAPERKRCLQRMRRALEDFILIGTATNIPQLRRILHANKFVEGDYSTAFSTRTFAGESGPDKHLRDLAVAAAVLYARRNQTFYPVTPERTKKGWHRDSRRLPR